MYVPSDTTAYVEGDVPDHPPPPTGGGVDDVVIWYPVTPSVSLAVNDIIGMLRLVDELAAVNAVTTGGVVSTVTVTGKANTADTLPTASFAHG